MSLSASDMTSPMTSASSGLSNPGSPTPEKQRRQRLIALSRGWQAETGARAIPGDAATRNEPIAIGLRAAGAMLYSPADRAAVEALLRRSAVSLDRAAVDVVCSAYHLERDRPQLYAWRHDLLLPRAIVVWLAVSLAPRPDITRGRLANVFEVDRNTLTNDFARVRALMPSNPVFANDLAALRRMTARIAGLDVGHAS